MPEPTTPAPVDSVVIVGGGLAGFTTARELRARGFAGAVTIIDPEGLPYDRPPLSKEFLADPQHELAFVPPTWFTEHAVTLVAAHATALDPDAGTVACSDGTRVTGDAIVLALGGIPRRPPVPGVDLPGLHVLRTRADADALRAELRPGRRLCIVGAGLIGAEVASAASGAGCVVTLLDPVAVPLAQVVGFALAERLQHQHAEHGVRVVEAMVAAIRTTGDAHTVATSTGEDIVADAVLLAVGIGANTALAEDAGLPVDNGVLVDPQQRTAHPRVWAVGDVARTRTADGILLPRHEHWEAAMWAGETAAASLLGAEPPRHGAGWMWSDRYGHHVEATGDLTAGEPVLRRVDGVPVAEFRLHADQTMAGAAAIDQGTTIRAARRIIDRGIPVDPTRLADPDVPLKKLAR